MNYFKSSILVLLLGALVLSYCSCTKVASGYINASMYYTSSLLVVPRGQTVSTGTLVSNGSNTPLNVKLYHIYDSTGKIVDDIFTKTYPVSIWKAGYNSVTDTTYKSIMSKLEYQDLPPIIISSAGGVISSTSASLNIPTGTYSVDLQASNAGGSEILKNVISIRFINPVLVETNDTKTGNPGIGRAPAGTSSNTYIFNAYNVPYMQLIVNRVADTPNVLYLKIVDRNGVPFNPKTEIIPRPGVPQNLQYYQPDTYVASDTAMFVKYPIAPFPVASKGNAFLWYYFIKTSAVIIDSTSAWSSNPNNLLYQGTSDPHYLGTYKLGRYDLTIKIPCRIQVPGSYIITEKILNATHR